MGLPEIKYCPGTLSEGFDTYSRTALNRVFQGRKVHHVLPYDSPASNPETDELFEENRKRMSISGVQEKFSVLLDKNKLRLINEDEHGTYILKPIPGAGRKPDQMPANEHLIRLPKDWLHRWAMGNPCIPQCRGWRPGLPGQPVSGPCRLDATTESSTSIAWGGQSLLWSLAHSGHSLDTRPYGVFRNLDVFRKFENLADCQRCDLRRHEPLCRGALVGWSCIPE